MKKSIYLFTLAIFLSLAACQSNGSGSATPTIDESATATVSVPIVNPPTLETPDTTPVGTANQGSNEGAGNETFNPDMTGQPMPGCTLATLISKPNPTEVSLFKPVTDQDWAIGPEDAAVTIVEYGDFQ